MRKIAFGAVFIATLVIGGSFLSADEGMWLLNKLPLAQLKEKYNFVPTEEWVEKVQKSSARLPNCSASFVSADGLIMTNGHCGEDAVMSISTPANNYYKNGFYADTPSKEKKTGLSLMVLERIIDVQGVPQRIIEGVSPEAGLECESVSLYQGAITQRYCYKVYNDIRLVFSSEKNTWFFGGDADNFEYPRYALDMAFLRAYENNKPAKTPLHFKWSKSGASEGELIFVSGHPGRTSRLFTSSSLATERDMRAPFILDLARRRELTIQQFMLRGKEQRRIAESDLFSWQNTRKLYAGKVRGLQDSDLMQSKEQYEFGAMLAAVTLNPELGNQLREGRKLVQEAQEVKKALFPKIVLYAGGSGFDSRLYDYAVSLISENRNVARSFFEGRQGEAPLNLEYEEAKLRDSLSHLIEVMGTDDIKIRSLFNHIGTGPDSISHHLIYQTRLSDINEHRRLVDGGAEAVKASDDPLIRFARTASENSKLYIERWKQALALEKEGYAKIADATFKVYGTGQYPDATFTLRLSFGRMVGYNENNRIIRSSTTIGGAYRHSAEFENAGDYKLPAKWIQRKPFVNLKTPLNFVSNLDITGGNSGSPVFNKDLEIVGLVFDGNSQSLVSDYDYNYSNESRAVSVHSAGIIEILKKIYRADALVAELTAK